MKEFISTCIELVFMAHSVTPPALSCHIFQMFTLTQSSLVHGCDSSLIYYHIYSIPGQRAFQLILRFHTQNISWIHVIACY